MSVPSPSSSTAGVAASATLISGCYVAHSNGLNGRIEGIPIEKTVTCVDSISSHLDTFKFNNRVFVDT